MKNKYKLDALHQELEIDDYVAVPMVEESTPKICRVDRFTPKMVWMVGVGNDNAFAKYSYDIFKLPPDEVDAYLKTAPVDLLRKPLAIDDYVFTADGKYVCSELFQIVKFAPPLAEVKEQGANHTQFLLLSNIIKVDPRIITMYHLTKDQYNG